MTVRLTLFGLITSLFVGLVYVMTKPVIIEAKEQARQEKLYLLAAPLLANGRIASPVQRELPDDAPASFEHPLSITPIVTDAEQLGVVLPITLFRVTVAQFSCYWHWINNSESLGSGPSNIVKHPDLATELKRERAIGCWPSMG